MENVVQKLAEYMASLGHESYVVTYNRLRRQGKMELPTREVINGVNVIRIKPDFAWAHGSYSKELPDVIREIDPDVLHVHGWRHPLVFQVARLKKRMQFKAIIHTHAPFHSLNQLGFVVWLYHRSIDRFMANSLAEFDAVVALTPFERDVLVERLKVPREKITCIPNGLDDDFERYSNSFKTREHTVLYMGALSRLKNVQLLADSMGRVISKVPDARLILAGEDQGALSNVMRNEKSASFEYVGVVKDTERYKTLGTAQVFVHPCLYEAFGISLIEAQSLGKPCVITGEGGQLYSAPVMKTSLHAEPNPTDFGDKIVKLLTNSTLYDELSQNATSWAFEHRWSKLLPKYDALYGIG